MLQTGEIMQLTRNYFVYGSVYAWVTFIGNAMINPQRTWPETRPSLLRSRSHLHYQHNYTNSFVTTLSANASRSTLLIETHSDLT